MVKFIHLADCHLGGWRQEELQELNFLSFQAAIKRSIEECPDFILIAGDLFDSAYPPIEILKRTFAEFKKIKDANIPVFLIAGSHDFSASGKTFLDVLEHAGFCKNIEDFETTEDGTHKLKPVIYRDVAIFGFPGRKSGMEIDELKKSDFDSVHQTTIFMLHTTIKDVVGTIPMDSIEKTTLPLADYYALGHIHKRFETQEKNSVFAYPGPTFPNNFQELADLNHGSFNIVKLENGKTQTQNIQLPLKEVVFLEIKLENALIATDKVISEIDKIELNNKILLLKLTGTLTQGKTGDINFETIENFVKKKNIYSFLRNISSLKVRESEIDVSIEDTENIEEEILKSYVEKNPGDFNKFMPQLMDALSIEKNEDEKSTIFEKRLIDELKKVLDLQETI
jgi:DNA repair protein SbcD/Mre11